MHDTILYDGWMQVSPDVLALYKIIETNFRPISIVKDSMPHLDTLTSAGGDLARSAQLQSFTPN